MPPDLQTRPPRASGHLLSRLERVIQNLGSFQPWLLSTSADHHLNLLSSLSSEATAILDDKRTQDALDRHTRLQQEIEDFVYKLRALHFEPIDADNPPSYVRQCKTLPPSSILYQQLARFGATQEEWAQVNTAMTPLEAFRNSYEKVQRNKTKLKQIEEKMSGHLEEIVRRVERCRELEVEVDKLAKEMKSTVPALALSSRAIIKEKELSSFPLRDTELTHVEPDPISPAGWSVPPIVQQHMSTVRRVKSQPSFLGRNIH
ncbi:hypothetical protein T439DRAFT_354033 [Meredithblackwellia eburnea MCA 4105]